MQFRTTFFFQDTENGSPVEIFANEFLSIKDLGVETAAPEILCKEQFSNVGYEYICTYSLLGSIAVRLNACA
jgi:hypothetical protein